jgi:hypothetical protein
MPPGPAGVGIGMALTNDPLSRRGCWDRHARSAEEGQACCAAEEGARVARQGEHSSQAGRRRDCSSVIVLWQAAGYGAPSGVNVFAFRSGCSLCGIT